MKLKMYSQDHYSIGRSKIIVMLWWIVQGTIFRYSLHNMYSFRSRILKAFGCKLGKDVRVRASAKFHYPWNVEIGDYSWIGDDVYFYSLDKIIVGKNSVVSQKTYLCTGSHLYGDKNFKLITKPIIIKDEVWIATDCFLHPGVTINDRVVVSARSNVIKDLESDFVYAGNPAKVLKSI